MSELNVYHHELRPNEYAEFYLKYEADKVIADLEESHKMEVEQLLMEIAELEERIADGDKDFEIANHQNEHLLKLVLHHKYKRCLAMARMCEERSARYDVLQERHDLDWGREIELYYRWYMRWLELAGKFKDKEAKKNEQRL